VLAILDDAVRFGELAAARGGGERTLDLSAVRHRSRAARRARRNVVSFSRDDIALSSSSSSEDEPAQDEEEEEGEGRGEEPEEPRGMERIAADLEAHVRAVRRGVEALAAGAGEGAETFGVLAFALADWDR
jgi:gamma-tubulin complex component 5